MLTNLLWMSPLWGWALPAAVLLPAVAHWLSQRGGTLAVFPSVRFIRMAAAANRRWRRLRDWLLFLLRLLILVLVVGAFAQPVWLRADQSLTSVHDAQPVVLIVDASASMQRTYQGLSLFERAKAEAIAGLHSLDPSRDRAMVIVLDGNPQPTLPRMSGNFSLLIQRLQDLQPTWQAGDLKAALRLAASPAMDGQDRLNLADLEIHLYSDMQKTQWPEPEQLVALLQGRKLMLHPQGQGGDPSNIALTAPSLWPSQVIVGQPAEARVEVVNYSAQSQAAQVTLVETAGKAMPSQSKMREVTLPAGGRMQLSFPLRIDTQEMVSLRLSLSGDGGAMSADDQTGLFTRPAGARQVAVVTQADARDPAQAAYYLVRALSPATAQSDMAVNVLSPQQVAAGLQQSSLACVVMIQTGALDAGVLRSLERYLQSGGAVWWIIDTAASGQSLLNWRDEEQATMAPVRLPAGTVAERAWITGQRVTLHSARFDDPMLRVFEGPARAQLLQTQFMDHLRSRLASDAQGLVMLGDDTPALAARAIGQGRLAVWTTSWSPQGSDWVKQPLFLPLVQQVVRTLAPGPVPAGNPAPGSSPMLTLAVEGGRSAMDQSPLKLQQPDGTFVALAEAQEMDGQWVVQLPVLAAPGAYGVLRGDQTLAGVQVDVDPAESDLTPWQPDLTNPPALAAGDAADGAAAPTPMGHEALRQEPVALWPWLVALAAAMVVAESIIAGSLSSKKHSIPTSVATGGAS